ncbi:unnamed protein product, partial [Ectocarpus sp. 12 AP-2014]
DRSVCGQGELALPVHSLCLRSTFPVRVWILPCLLLSCSFLFCTLLATTTYSCCSKSLAVELGRLRLTRVPQLSVRPQQNLSLCLDCQKSTAVSTGRCTTWHLAGSKTSHICSQ